MREYFVHLIYGAQGLVAVNNYQETPKDLCRLCQEEFKESFCDNLDGICRLCQKEFKE